MNTVTFNAEDIKDTRARRLALNYSARVCVVPAFLERDGSAQEPVPNVVISPHDFVLAPRGHTSARRTGRMPPAETDSPATK